MNSPFDDFRRLLRHMPETDRDAAARARTRADDLGRMHGDFGGFAELAAWHASWQGRVPPMILRPTVAVFAGTNASGDAAGNVAATRALAERAAQGKAAANALAGLHNLSLKVLDLALDLPVGDIAVQAALDERATAATMAFGMEAVAGGSDLLAFADFGRGNVAHAQALAMVLLGVDAGEFDAPASGEADADVAARSALAQRAVAFHRRDAADPFEALARLGTREIAAIAGAIIAARMEKTPVLLDGPAALAAATALYAADPRALAHCRLAARLAGGFGRAAGLIGLDPVVDCDWRLVGGVGAALAAVRVKAAAQLLVDMG